MVASLIDIGGWGIGMGGAGKKGNSEGGGRESEGALFKTLLERPLLT